MAKRYYFCTFVGDGTVDSPFRPIVSLHAKVLDSVDCRPDRKKPDGWCFTSADTEDHSHIEQLSGVISLGDDPYALLSRTIRERLNQELHVDLISESLTDILAELLLSDPSFRSVNGKYNIQLGDLLKEFSEDEAEEFIGRILIQRTPAQNAQIPVVPSGKMLTTGGLVNRCVNRIRRQPLAG